MRLDAGEARERFAAARVARLATVDADGRPHLVPITFAVLGGAERDTLAFAIDHKPKTTMRLHRLANIAANPAVCLLVDVYAEEWDQLWWARADGTARVLEPGDPAGEPALAALIARYAPYRGTRPAGPVVLVDVTRWSGWSAA